LAVAPQPAPLNTTELAPLLAALRPWRRTSWFKQLKARLAPHEVAQPLLDASAPEPMVSGGGATLAHLVRGLLEHRLVRITYRRREHATQYRVTIEPARLRVAGGLFYLDAHVRPGARCGPSRFT
jgi:predicted DNA-binding transcriptional regulator YafY